MSYEIQKPEEHGSHVLVYGQDEYLQKPKQSKKNNPSASFASNIDGSFAVGTRSSFGSSTRSNSSSLGTNGTNNSLSSRGSVAETHNMHAPNPSRSSPSTSTLGDTFSRKMESQITQDAEKEIKTVNDKSDGYGNEYFALNSWNAEKISRDATAQSGSLSSFSSSNGSSRNLPPSNRSISSSDRK